MRFLNFNRSKPAPVLTETKMQMPSMATVKFSLPELPIIKEVRGKEWIFFGVDNLYPQHLERILSMSPTQGAIIKGKAGMMAGDGILINDTTDKASSKALLESLDINVQTAFKEFIENKNGDEDLEEVIYKACYDFQKLGSFALEVIFSMDFTRIATIKHVNSANVRSGKMVNGKVSEYYYSRDWFYFTKEGFKPQKIAAFDQDNKESYNQLIYVKCGTLEYYGMPSFSECISYIELESKLATYQLSSVTNGFSPSLLVKYFMRPAPEEQHMIMDAMKRQYAGEQEANKAMVFFSDGKELSPEVTPINIQSPATQLLQVQENVVQNILTGNQITSPQLFGITVPTGISNGTELGIAYNIFNRSTIEPDRKKIEKVLNKILQINKVPLTVSLMPFNPLV